MPDEEGRVASICNESCPRRRKYVCWDSDSGRYVAASVERIRCGTVPNYDSLSRVGGQWSLAILRHPIESGGQISGLGERFSAPSGRAGGGGEVADGVAFDPCVDDRTALLACFDLAEAHCALIIWEGGVPMTPPQQFR